MPKNDKTDHLERRLRLAADPLSVVLAPKTTECHRLVRIMYDLDKALNRMRLLAVTRIPIDLVNSCLQKVKETINMVEDAIKVVEPAYNERFYSYYFMGVSNISEIKKVLAQRPRSYVFSPRTEEGRRLASLITVLDPLLLIMKTTSTDMERVFESTSVVLRVTEEIYQVTKDISNAVGLESKRITVLEEALKEEI